LIKNKLKERMRVPHLQKKILNKAGSAFKFAGWFQAVFIINDT